MLTWATTWLKRWRVWGEFVIGNSGPDSKACTFSPNLPVDRGPHRIPPNCIVKSLKMSPLSPVVLMQQMPSSWPMIHDYRLILSVRILKGRLSLKFGYALTYPVFNRSKCDLSKSNDKAQTANVHIVFIALMTEPSKTTIWGPSFIHSVRNW